MSDDDVTQLHERHLFEKAASKVLQRAGPLQRLAVYHRLVRARIRTQALVDALDEPLDERQLAAMLDTDADWRDIAAAVPLHNDLKPDVCWALLVTLRSEEGAFGLAMDAYFERHPSVPTMLPYRVVLHVTRRQADERPLWAAIVERQPGQPDIDIVFE